MLMETGSPRQKSPPNPKSLATFLHASTAISFAESAYGGEVVIPYGNGNDMTMAMPLLMRVWIQQCRRQASTNI